MGNNIFVFKLILTVLIFEFNHKVVLSTSGKGCHIPMKGECQCKEYIDDSITGIRVECAQTTSSKLLDDIDSLRNSGKNILGLQVRNSNLRDLSHLPSGLHNVHELILDNTGIDLETIRESNEMLKMLKRFRVYHENFTEIPEDFFLGMDELKNLALNDIGIAYISKDAFSNLEDSLKHLELRENKLRSFPIAIQVLSHLESLDLFGNEIKTVPDDLTFYLQSSLKRLKKLTLNYINCTCGFGKTDFATWIRSHAIKGVTCKTPNRLFGKDISTTPIEEFCEFTSNSSTNANANLILVLVFLAKFFTKSLSVK